MGKNIKSRGCHSTIFPVQLPPWLPSSVLEEMVARFEIFLLQEITSMMMQEPARCHYPSRPDSSIASDERDPIVDIGFPSI